MFLRDGIGAAAMRRGTIAIQDRCYDGGHLGTGDAENVCDAEQNVFFWDMVHPGSYTHCWLAFFVERDLVRAGLLADSPDPLDHRGCSAERQAAPTPAAARRGPAEVSAP